jgi:transcriptional regulator with XRE-family HTH domain
MHSDQDFSWQELGHRVKDWRMRAGLSQKQLAKAAGLTPAGLFRIEAGNTNPQLETLRSIAAALGRSVREMFCGHLKDDTVAGPRAAAYRVVDRVLESGDEAALNVLSSAILTCQVLLDRRSRVSGQDDEYLLGWRLPKPGEKTQEVRSAKKYRVQRGNGEWITIGGSGKSETNAPQSTPNLAETPDHDDE